MGLRHLMGLPAGFNWFLILIVCVVAILVVVSSVYVLVYFQHPDDVNQAWFPKVVVILSLSIAIFCVLLFPLDVANRGACKASLSETACTFTLPMRDLWFAVYITNLVLVWVIIPFTIFFYEADSDFTFFERIKAAGVWVILTLVVLGMSIGLAYALAGYVDYPTIRLDSGVLPISELGISAYDAACIKPGSIMPGVNASTVASGLCDYRQTPRSHNDTWKLRVSFPVYIMAIQSVIGWILFMVYAGVGVLAGPIDWFYQFLGRPKTIITRSEYVNRARDIAHRAKAIKESAQMLRKAEKNRKWRSQFKQLQKELVLLEGDEEALDRVFPAGADGDVKWVTYQIGFYLLGALSVIGMGVSLMWLLHIVLYLLPVRPISPLLNKMFVALDDVFPLFGVAAFTLFCLYLMIVAIKGSFMVGMNLIVVNLYPMRPGATLMSSFLFNTAIILTMSPAVIQFCAEAFGIYASGTAIFDIFGNQVSYLRGIRWIYSWNIFLYIFLAITAVSTILFAIRGPKQWVRRKREDAYKDAF